MTTLVYVPRETSAVSMGADEVAERLAQLSDVQIIRNGSRGASWLEPLVEVVVNDERIAYGPITVNHINNDVESLIAANFTQGGEHPKLRGPIAEIPYLAKQQRWTFERIGLIDPLSVEQYQKANGFAGLTSAFAMDPTQVIQQIKASGLRGRGGAAFPTGIKWQTVADAKGEQKYITCNADEGDSGTFSDRLLMEGDPLALIEGMIIAGYAVGANKGYVYLRSEYPLTKTIFTEALDVAKESGWLGNNIQNSGFSFAIELHIGAGSYVCGEETAMLESLEGKAGLVRFKPPLPALEGLFGKPTVVNNVVTLASVPNILFKGAAQYASYGEGRSKGTLAFQLAGNVKRGGLVELAFGSSLRELIEEFGGGTATGRPIRAVQVGGPLGAYLPESQLDIALDYEQFAAVDALIGHGGIVVFDDTVDMAAQARFAFEFCAKESCGKCTPCRIGSVRGVEVIDKILNGDNVNANRILLNDLCDTLVDGSLCAMGGMTPFPVRSALKHFDADFHFSPAEPGDTH